METKAKGKEIQLVIFRLRDEEFGVEIGAVLEISRVITITHVPQAPGFIDGVINLRGRIIAVVDLARQFGLKEQSERPKTARIVVVEVGGQTVGLLVDEVPEVLHVPEDAVEPAPEIIQTEVKRDYIKGVAKLGERLVILLHLEQVFAPHEVGAVAELNAAQEAKRNG